MKLSEAIEYCESQEWCRKHNYFRAENCRKYKKPITEAADLCKADVKKQEATNANT